MNGRMTSIHVQQYNNQLVAIYRLL